MTEVEKCIVLGCFGWITLITPAPHWYIGGLHLMPFRGAFVVIVCRAGLTTAPHAGLPFYSEACHTFVGSTIKALVSWRTTGSWDQIWVVASAA